MSLKFRYPIGIPPDVMICIARTLPFLTNLIIVYLVGKGNLIYDEKKFQKIHKIC